MQLNKGFKLTLNSDIGTMTRLANEVDGINLGQGVCDLPIAPEIKQAAIEAIESDKSIYSYPEGASELRTAIAKKLKAKNGIVADADEQIVVTVGAAGAFTVAINTLLNRDDGILFFEPYYPYHINTAFICGFEPQIISRESPNFDIDSAKIEEAIKPNTRAIVVNTPCNPSGKMWSSEELETLSEIANKHDLWVITDEIYENIIYDKPHISPATITGLKDRTLTIMGFSKTFSITGWRLGYLVAPPKVAALATKVSDMFNVCAPTPLQFGVCAGLNMPEDFYSEIRSFYRKNRDALCEALTQAGLAPIEPQGAYYVLANVKQLGFDTAIDAAKSLLNESGVAAVPGTSFWQGPEGESHLRFCFACKEAVLHEACDRLVSSSN